MSNLSVFRQLSYPVKVNWPNVLEARAPAIPNREPIFSARLVFPKDHPDYEDFIAVATKLAKAVAPKGADLTIGARGFFWPFQAGDQLIQEAKERAAKAGKDYGNWDDYMAGCDTLYTKTGAKNPPQLDFFNGRDGYTEIPWADRMLHKDKFYTGMEAVGSVTFHGWISPLGFGVSCYLNALGSLVSSASVRRRTIHTYIPKASDFENEFAG